MSKKRHPRESPAVAEMSRSRDLDGLRRIVREEVQTLREDYARGIPDFVLVQIARDASESMRQHLVRNIEQTTVNPVDRRRKSAAASIVLQELEVKIKELLEDKLSSYLRAV